MKNLTRSTNVYGITDQPASMKTFDGIVSSVKNQHDRLTAILKSYQDECDAVAGNNSLTEIGKLPLRTDLKIKYQAVLNKLRLDPEYKVAGEDELRAKIVPKVTTSGDATLDFLRDQEIRSVIRSVDSGTRMSAIISSNNPDVITAVMRSPIAIDGIDLVGLQHQLERIGADQNQNAVDRLEDFSKIREQLEANFFMAEKFLKTPVAV